MVQLQVNWNQFYLNTFLPEVPKMLNDNYAAFKRYIDVFYDETKGILLKPVETTGRVKGAKGEFVTAVIDNLIVRNQFTNLYENSTTADLNFVTAYTGPDASNRIATSETSTNIIWPYEPSAYKWVDVNKPYYKINNDVSMAFNITNIGQEFQLIFDTSVAELSPYNILIESSVGGQQNIQIGYSDANTTWIKLIMISYDVSWGPKWVVKQYGGIYTLV